MIRGRSTRRAGRRRPWLRYALLGILVIGGLVVIGVQRSNLLEGTIGELTLPLRYDSIIRQQAEDKDVDAALIAAVIYTESRFRDQTSSAGARGLMQITPDTADVIERLSGGETFVTDDLADPNLNIRYGTFFLSYLLDRYEGSKVAALAAYNAGQTNADAWGGADMEKNQIQFPETREYVRNVLEKRGAYEDRYADELGL